jgi:O-antigen/teichoic acid export membrane protein
MALAPAFVVNGLGVQHVALLQRHLRYITLSSIEVASQLVSAAVSIGMALAGFGYWSLVAAVIAVPACVTIGAWLATGWIPRAPRRGSGIGSMLRFGGTVTLNGLVVYAAYNFEKVLLGRYFGSDALGLYGRAYQLVNMPTQALNVALGGVAFAALARLQGQPARFKSYFLKGYSLIVSITLPATIFCAVLANDIILVLLGPKWHEAASIFRLLAPTILVFGIINPLGWLLQSIGLQERSLKIAFVIAPLVCCAYLIGIPYGPNGVAFAYSAAMSLWLIPHVLWCLYGTPIAPKDLLTAAGRPLVSGLVAAAVALVVQHLVASIPYAVVRLALAGGAMLVVYAATLLFVMSQKALFADVLRGLRGVPDLADRNATKPLRQEREALAP